MTGDGKTYAFASVLSCAAMLLAACSHSDASQVSAGSPPPSAMSVTASPKALRTYATTALPSHAPMQHVAPAPVVRHASSEAHLVRADTKVVAFTPPAPRHVAVAAQTQPHGMIVRMPHAAPGIVRIVMPSSGVASGQLVRASVFTTSNTASVEARIYGYAMPLQKVEAGHFRLVYRVPDIPFYLHREWPVQVIARNVDGQSASKQVTVSVH